MIIEDDPIAQLHLRRVDEVPGNADGGSAVDMHPASASVQAERSDLPAVAGRAAVPEAGTHNELAECRPIPGRHIQ